MDSLKCQPVHNILGLALVGQDVQVLPLPNPGATYIELPMGEARVSQVKSCHLQGLALGLVDSHRIAYLDGKLEPFESERAVIGDQSDSGDTDLLTC